MKRNLDLICRHCLRSYDESGRDYGNYGTGLCFPCFEADQEGQTELIRLLSVGRYHEQNPEA